MTPESFAEELATRLTEILPPGFRAYAYFDWVGVSDSGPTRGGVSVDVIAVDRARDELEVFEFAAIGVLSGAQDAVSIGLRTPWPQGVGYGPSEMAPPYAKREGDMLYVGYGDESEMVISLRPLHLT